MPIPKDLTPDQQWARSLTQTYEGEIRKNSAEQVKLRKQGNMKDSLRLSLAEMAEVHYNQGYLDDAILAW